MFRERRLFVAAAIVVPLMRAMLVLLPFRLVLRIVRSLAREGTRPALSPTEIVQIVDAVARRIPGTRCLARVLAAAALLVWHGHPATMRLGVATGGSQVSAHAWIESLGTPAPAAFVVLPPIELTAS